MTPACLLIVPVTVVPWVPASLVPPVVLVLPSRLNRRPSVVTLLIVVGPLALRLRDPSALLTLRDPIALERRWSVSRLNPVPRLRQ